MPPRYTIGKLSSSSSSDYLSVYQERGAEEVTRGCKSDNEPTCEGRHPGT